MVHEGVVLQQFTLENTGDTSVDLGSFTFQFTPDHLIRDLDFLDASNSFNDVDGDHKSYTFMPGPNGYARVGVHVQDEDSEGEGEGQGSLVEAQATILGHEATGASNHSTNSVSSHTAPHLASDQFDRVASVMTVFVNGSATESHHWDNLLEGYDNQLHGKGTDIPGGNKLQIVVAHKLISLPHERSSWKNFVISAEAANINHWLREEEKAMWDEDDGTTSTALCLVGLPVSKSKDTNLYATHKIDGSRDKNKEVAPPLSSGGPPGFSMPTGTPGAANPKDHLEYFTRRHLEHLLSVCSMPLSTPKLITDVDSDDGPEEPSLAVTLTCGDISGHRVNTSASL